VPMRSCFVFAIAIRDFQKNLPCKGSGKGNSAALLLPLGLPLFVAIAVETAFAFTMVGAE